MDITVQILAVVLIIILVLLAIFIIQVPIMIARRNGINGSDLTTIVVLSWFGIFFGITWIVALVLSLIWGPTRGGDTESPHHSRGTDIDKLEQLHRLKKQGAITQKEFDAEKKKILK
ncbi:MAG: SHOCT domain-containing protein [Proteobacteria bacterium]|nr:SHOCT domain-containing protein [Pseudomonadota bacterium]